MAPETKSEVIIVGIAGAVLLFVWLSNRQGAGVADSSGSALPLLSNPSSPVTGGATMFDIPAPVPGLDVSYSGSGVTLPAPNQFTLDAGLPSACNCAGSGQGGSTFGSPADLAAWLTAQPGVVSSANDALTNWN